MATYETRTLSPGIAPAEIALINSTNNYSGNTKLGLMIYSHGTTYNGGNAPTVTLTGGGGTLTSVDTSKFIPYQMADGSWRMKFNVQVTVSVQVRTSLNITIAGVTFPNYPNGEQLYGSNVGGTPLTYCQTTPNTGQVVMGYASVNTTNSSWSGDVALASKPSWAY